MALQLITWIYRYLVDNISELPATTRPGSRAYDTDTQLWYIFDGTAWGELTDETVIAEMGGDLTGPATAAELVAIGGQSIALAAPNLDISANPPATLVLPAVAVHSLEVAPDPPTVAEFDALVDKFNALLGVTRSLINRDMLFGLVT